MKINPFSPHVARAAIPQPLIVERLLHDPVRCHPPALESGPRIQRDVLSSGPSYLPAGRQVVAGVREGGVNRRVQNPSPGRGERRLISLHRHCSSQPSFAPAGARGKGDIQQPRPDGTGLPYVGPTGPVPPYPDHWPCMLFLSVDSQF